VIAAVPKAPGAPRLVEPQLPAPLALAGSVVYCAVGVLSGVIEVLLIPLYIGSVIFPITVLIAIIGNVLLPHLVHSLVDWKWAISAPFVGWLLAVIALSYFNNSSGTVLVPGYGQGQYVGLALFFIGTLAGFIGVVRELGRLKARTATAPATTPRATAGRR
jgi:hypothetical protein